MSCCYTSERTLYVHVTSMCTSTPLLLLRGPGIRDPEGLSAVRELAADPDVTELTREVTRYARSADSCVIAGLGEPTARMDAMLAVAHELSGRLPLRLNTNGLGSLMHGRDIVPEIVAAGISMVSIGLNAANRDDYEAIMAPALPGAFEAALDFIRSCAHVKPPGAGLRVEVTCVETPGVDVAAVRRLVEGLDVEFRVKKYDHAIQDEQACPPCALHRAAADGDLGFVVSTAYARDEVENTALIWAADRGHLHVVERLLRLQPKAADLSAAGISGNTAVHRACRWGYEEILRRLVTARAPVSIGNVKQQTPLHFAAFYGHRSCVVTLLEARADTSMRDTALSV